MGDDLGNNSAAALTHYLEQIESCQSEIAEVRDRISDIFQMAQSAGFDPTIMREILKLRQMDPHDLQERNALINTYARAVGLDFELSTPLGRYGLSVVADNDEKTVVDIRQTDIEEFIQDREGGGIIVKVSLSGLLTHAHALIPEFEISDDDDADIEQEYNNYLQCNNHCNASRVLSENMIEMGAFIQGLLEETAENIRKVTAEPEQLDKFLELYCLPSVEDYLKKKAGNDDLSQVQSIAIDRGYKILVLQVRIRQLEAILRSALTERDMSGKLGCSSYDDWACEAQDLIPDWEDEGAA